MLKELHLQQVGPAAHFDVAFADRLNIFTGDNGLGKSFLLDIAWWVMTTNWAEQPAYPQRVKGENPQITAVVSNKKNIREYQSQFDFSEQQWRNLQMPPLLKEVVIYVRVDGSFSVFDPARQRDIAYNFNPNTLEAAEAWMRDDDMNAFPENLRIPTQIHQELQRVLPGHDPFWPRWIVTTEKRNSGLSGV